ncbi:NADH-quinone oxidoreductase subunit L, partial [Pelagibacteraceae bacterium]|nr:NADH-quinone oxidoreductase subunit L [Pelagibacteraceae bacterium]
MPYLIVFLPLIGAILGYSLKVLGDRFTEVITTAFLFLSGILSIIIFYNGVVYGEYENYKIIEWISSGNFKVDWSINIDPLSSIMLIVVTSVSSLVHLYSIGYMSHDPNKPRFMAYLSLFTFAMLMLVVSDNFLQLFFGWEGVGLCSYLL